MRSSLRTSSGVASPSRTRHINCRCSGLLMSGGDEVLEEHAEALPCLEQPRLYPLLVEVEDFPDFLVAALGEVAQREHGAIARAHFHQRRLYAARKLGLARARLGPGAFAIRCIEFAFQRILAAVAAQQVERLVEGDAIDPAEEAKLRIVVVEVLGDPEEHDLRDVACILPIPQHAVCGVVDRPLVADHELGEGSAVAVAVTLHQQLVAVLIPNYTGRSRKLAGITRPARFRRSGRNRSTGRCPAGGGSRPPGAACPRRPSGASGSSAARPGPHWICTRAGCNRASPAPGRGRGKTAPPGIARHPAAPPSPPCHLRRNRLRASSCP